MDDVTCVAPIELMVLNLETRKTFNKPFFSAYLARKFINKVRHSKKVKVIGVFGNLG